MNGNNTITTRYRLTFMESQPGISVSNGQVYSEVSDPLKIRTLSTDKRLAEGTIGFPAEKLSAINKSEEVNWRHLPEPNQNLIITIPESKLAKLPESFVTNE